MSNPFNISLGSYTNTLSADDNIVANVVVANNDSYAYLNALQITPTLTPQNLSSFLSLTFPSKMLISESYNLTLLLSSTNMSYITIQTQPFMQQLTLCCIDPTCNQTLISSCTLISSSSSSNVSIQLTLSTVTPVTIVTLGFVTVPYQYLAANSSIAISIGLPSSSIYKIQNIMVYGSPLSSSLTVGNYVVNAINNFTLQIQPLSRVGYLSIQLPTRIAAQISSSSSTTMLSGTVNNRPLPISLIGSPANTIQITLGSGNSAITAVTILLQNVTNPPSNEPIQFVVQQSSDASQRMVYGYASLDTAMSQFDLVTLALAERNDTKIGMPI